MQRQPFASLVLLCLGVTLAGMSIAVAGNLAFDQHDQLKAAYVLKIVEFVEWPATTEDTFDLCVLGAKEIHAFLKVMAAGKRIGERRIVLHILRASQGATHCEVLYVDEHADIPAALRSVEGHPTLTMGDAPDFVGKNGGMIQLFVQDNRLRFDVHLSNARRAGLKISADLLKLASHVEQEPAP